MSGVRQPYARRRAPAQYDPGWFDAEHQNIQRSTDGAEALLPVVSVDDFRGLGSKVTNTLQFQRAAAAASAAAPCKFVIPSAKYVVTDRVALQADRIHVSGDGKYAPQITHNPAVGASPELFYFASATPGVLISQCSLWGIGVIGAGARQKILASFVGASESSAGDIACLNMTGAKSEGIRTAGHEFFNLQRCDLQADLPLHLMADATYPSQGADMFHFHDCDLIGTDATEYNVTIEADVGLANLLFSGEGSWVAGLGGLRAKAGAAPATALKIAIGPGYRYEQPMTTGGWAVDWEMAARCLDVDMNLGGLGASTNGGLKVRNVRKISCRSPIYSGSGGAVALDLDSTCDEYWQWNAEQQDGSVANISGLSPGLQVGKRNTNAPLSPTCYYYNNATTNPLLKIAGVASAPVAAAAQDLTLGFDTTNNRLIFYVGGARYFANATAF